MRTWHWMGWCVLSAWCSYGSVARADMCFGGGGRDGEDPAKGTAGEAGDSATSSLLRPGTRQYAGGGLVFLGALGSLWLLGRRKGTGRGE